MMQFARILLIIALAVISADSVAQDALADAIDARIKAEQAGAARLASESWKAAGKRLEKSEQASRNGNLDTAREQATRAEKLFLTAELEAIKQQLLGKTASLIATAEKQKAEKFAIRSFNQAQMLLLEASNALRADRYDTEKASALAAKARDQVTQAMYITALAKQVREKDLTVEGIIMDWGSYLKKTAETANVTADLSTHHGDTFRLINKELERLQQENSQLTDDLQQRVIQVAGLEDELRELDQRLRGAASERRNLVSNLQSQARIREQFLQIETMFNENEAAVWRESDTIILRLAGLRFTSGSAEISKASGPLLEKVHRAISIFPRSDLIVEGHTDAQGSNTMNLRLSQERADSVMTYFVDILRIPAHRIKATGYGDTRPIANNASEQGRARNRRIDIIISPQLETVQ